MSDPSVLIGCVCRARDGSTHLERGRTLFPPIAGTGVRVTSADSFFYFIGIKKSIADLRHKSRMSQTSLIVP